MKILFVAVFKPGSTNISQAEGFERNGCEVIRYDYRLVATKIGVEARDNDIIEVVRKEKPDITVFSKCNKVNSRVIDEINPFTLSVLWFMDPKAQNFNTELIEKIEKCHYTFCALTRPYKEASKYSDSVFFLQEGFDQDVDKPHDIPYLYDVSFIGNLDGNRNAYYDIFQFATPKGFGEEHARIVSSSRINLNFVRGAGDGTSDRTYKVLAAKGFLLTQPWEDMEQDFVVGKHFDTFTSPEELQEKLLYYLKNEYERDLIRKNGYEHIQKFNRTNWAKRILEIVS